MDLTQILNNYISRMANVSQKHTGVPQMKILLLDEDTLSYVSAVSTQRALLAQGIFLIDRLDNSSREKMRSLQCICYVRPTAASVKRLVEELQDPKYGEYYLYFSNVVKKSQLQQIAESDNLEVVKSVEELYGDYLVVNPDFFSLSLAAPSSQIWGSSPTEWNAESLLRCTDGLIAILQSLKKKPTIRYARSSGLAAKLANEVQFRISAEPDLFSFRKPDTPPVLLILDRRDDPITPLLTQWTYQAMVHELIGIQNGRVDLSKAPNVHDELKEIVLSQDQDPFFKNNMYLNFGDLGENTREYVQQFSSKSQNKRPLETIEDMKHFIEEYPEFRKLASNVTKHVTLVGELSRRVGTDSLFDISELEQSIACTDSHNSNLKSLQQHIQNPAILPEHKIRLAALYALRYQKHSSNATPMILDLLHVAGNVPKADVNLVHKLLAYANSVSTASADSSNTSTNPSFPDIFQPGSFFAGARDRLKGIEGVENVYTQHKPPLETIIQNLAKGKLKEDTYPVLDPKGTANGGMSTGTGMGSSAATSAAATAKAQDIIIFTIGGTTYEEARSVAKLNGVPVSLPPPGENGGCGGGGGPASSSAHWGANGNNNSGAIPGVRIVLGGTTVHNSNSFWEEVETVVAHWPTSVFLASTEQRGKR